MRITVSVCISFLNTFTPHNMTTYTISNNSSQLDSRSHPPPRAGFIPNLVCLNYNRKLTFDF